MHESMVLATSGNLLILGRAGDRILRLRFVKVRHAELLIDAHPTAEPRYSIGTALDFRLFGDLLGFIGFDLQVLNVDSS